MSIGKSHSLLYGPFSVVRSCMRRRSRQERDAKSKMVTRRSRQLKKRKVHFKQEVLKNGSQITRSTAVRSLFPTKSILELPNELVTLVLTYFNAKELLLLRCVSTFLLMFMFLNVSNVYRIII